MHQNVYTEAVAEEYIRLYNPLLFKKVHGKLFFVFFDGIVGMVQKTLDYADDGYDPLELLDWGNSEMDFIEWFVEEVTDQERFLREFC